MLGSIVEAMSPYPENVRAMNAVADAARSRAREAVEETGSGGGELEMDAAQYLAAHVAQVKLEAAESEFAWSGQVEKLQKHNRELSAQVARLERVVKENSLQWRLRERDDWKNLVEAVRKDRDRLDSENAKLQSRVASLERQLTTHGIRPLQLMSPKVKKNKKAPAKRAEGCGSGGGDGAADKGGTSRP